MKTKNTLILLCTLTLASTDWVRAEETTEAAESGAAEAPVAESERTGGLEEIIVTAQKRAENLQDVPIAIQAFSGDTLTDKGITDTQALTQITPGLVYNSNAGYAMAYVRGVGSDAPLPTADPSVATYVDGVYYPFVQSTIQSFADLERIEVLKGPQGTLFGRNTTAGAISIVTKDPGDTPETSITYEIGNYGKQRLSVYGATPVSQASRSARRASSSVSIRTTTRATKPAPKFSIIRTGDCAPSSPTTRTSTAGSTMCGWS